MKKLTLAQTWKYCLAMWKWIAKEIERDGSLNINDLKREWMKRHFPTYKFSVDCFFCEYQVQSHDNITYCSQCPGRLVSKRFSCGREAYHYAKKPTKFYQKLLRLDRERKKRVKTK